MSLPAAASNSATARRWRLPGPAPALGDFYFTALLVWLFAAGAGWQGLLADGDTGWHIRTGDYILQTGSVPRHDLFSYTRPGEPWFAWEWLADVGLALVHRLWGLSGVAAFSGLLIAAAMLALFRWMLWRGANLFVAVAVGLLATGACSVHFLARPHLATLLLLPLSLWMVERDLERARRSLWLLVALSVVWTNLHGGFLALPVTVAAMAAGLALEALGQPPAERSWRGPLRYALLAAACGAASIANPYGLRWHAHVAGYLSSDWIRNVVMEFRAPSFRSENQLQFQVLLLAGLLAAGWRFSTGRFREGLPVLLWAHLALGSVRHAPLFAMVAAPLVGSALTELWRKWEAWRGPRSVAAALGAVARDFAAAGRLTPWAAVGAAAVLWLTPATKWPRDFPDELFPTALAASQQRWLAAARLFTSDEWADYLIYRNWPKQRVFMDGRSDFYGPGVGDQYLAVMEGRPGWEEILKRYHCDAVLVSPRWTLHALLAQSRDWERVASDRRAVLYRRRQAPDVAGTNPRQQSYR
ncbi:MAG: hypothetical protein RMK57_03480 [Bryobacterales bacterium]|nr:hypothetical protein [Bryobacteraceae bacterium]MDW8353570.1 hypothetical protein [Bryobacterales bacterium]